MPGGPAARRAHHRSGRGDPLGPEGRRAPRRAIPESGLPVYAKSGRFGPYVQLGDADTLPPDTKPKMSSLFQTMSLSTHHARGGARGCSRCLGWSGEHPEGGEIVAAQREVRART